MSEDKDAQKGLIDKWKAHNARLDRDFKLVINMLLDQRLGEPKVADRIHFARPRKQGRADPKGSDSAGVAECLRE